MNPVEKAVEAARESSTTQNVEVVEKKISSDETYTKLRARVGPMTLTVRLTLHSGRVDMRAVSVDGKGFWFEDPASLHRVAPEGVPDMMHWMMNRYYSP